MQTSIDLLIRQEADTPELLQVFVSAAGHHDAFTVPRPAKLEQLQQAWRSRFLRHHDPAFAWPEGALVIRSKSEQLLQGLQSWLEQPCWAPLQRLLEQWPAVPLRLELSGSALTQLPWQALQLQRPIWRLNNPVLTPEPPWPKRARQPRVLLLIGSEQGLTLEREIASLQQLQRSGRIRLQVLRGATSSAPALRAALAEPSGWDALLYLGHSSNGPNGGVLHLGDGSQLDGQSLERDWAVAARQGLRLLLFNSCSGLQLAHHAVRAGIDWAVCFLEPVPTTAAATAFGCVLAALESGNDLVNALSITRQHLVASDGAEGCDLLLTAVASPGATRFHLPLRRRRQLALRLASTQRRQLAAAGLLTLVALPMELAPWNPLNTYLLNRRLDFQRIGRQLIHQPGPLPSKDLPAIPVLLLDPTTTIPELGVQPQPDHTARLALAAVLQRTPVAQVPLVGLDVNFNQDRPGTQRMAEVLRAQQGRRVFGGYSGNQSATCQGAGGGQWLQASSLVAAGLHPVNLALGTAASTSCDALKPVPLQLAYQIDRANFAGVLSSRSNPVFPADRIIDWSLNWADQIRLIEPADLPKLRAPLLLVGSSGRLGDRAADLFAAPATVQNALLRGDQPLWNGNAREVPGVLVQAVLIQSLNRGHWITPLSLSLCTLGAAALGVLLAALFEERRHRLIAVVLISAVSVPLAFTLAVLQLLLLPLLLPSVALSATAFSRDD